MTAHDYMQRVHEIGCVVCAHMGMDQTFQTEAHHVESVRDSGSTWAVAAICTEHHRGRNGVHGLGRAGFVARYKLTDIDLMAMTIAAVCRGMR